MSAVLEKISLKPQDTPTGKKMLVGLIGSGIQRSLTPAMQEREAAAQGLRLHYQLIDLDTAHDPAMKGPDALPTLLSAAKVIGFSGLNITFPCKQAIVPLLDELSDEVRAIGAVNTVLFRDGRLIGHNTDLSGWRRGFVNSLPNANLSRVVLLGAGGAGSAIAHAVLRLGAESLVLFDVDANRAEEFAARLNKQYAGQRVSAVSDIAKGMQGATGLIHATPTGMDKLPGLPLPAQLLRPDLWVSEVVYFPLETALLKAARQIGCAVSDGGGMAIGQAVDAFEIFTGLKADAARMDAHFRSMIAERIS